MLAWQVYVPLCNTLRGLICRLELVVVPTVNAVPMAKSPAVCKVVPLGPSQVSTGTPEMSSSSIAVQFSVKDSPTTAELKLLTETMTAVSIYK